MKKIITIIMMIMFIGQVKANQINSINVDVYLEQNGDAKIIEKWNYTSSNKTEIYHQFKNLGKSQIKNFNVVDSTNTQYQFVDDWNPDGTFNDKAYKYGYNYIDDGVELCLGLSHYGTYEYTMYYTVENMIYNLEDSQMLYWNFLPSTSDNLKKYYIKIHSFSNFDDELPIWGFGVYGDYAYVSDGIIEMSSKDEVEEDEYVTLLVKFPQGMYNTKATLDKNFDYYYNLAMDGAKTYSDKASVWEILIVIIVFILFFAIFIFIAVMAVNTSKYGSRVKNKKINKNAPYFRDLPCQKDIFRAYFIGSEYNVVNKETNLFGAILLKWLKNKNISIDNDSKNMKINLLQEPDDVLELELFNYMKIASKDDILEKNEFSRWLNNNYYKIYTWFTKVINEEVKKCFATEMIVKNDKKFGIKYNATERFDEIGNYLIGLKKYLKDFTLMKDKKPIEVNLWQEYLMYAQLFGIAKQVAKDFKNMYPEVVVDNTYNDIIILNSFSTHSINTMTSAREKAQSYSAGGGGFSSGGGGISSFGGGGSMGSR